MQKKDFEAIWEGKHTILKKRWKYNQILTYVEIYIEDTDVNFIIYKNEKRYRYDSSCKEYSIFSSLGNHFFVERKDTNETIKEKINIYLNRIREELFSKKRNHSYIDMEVFNNQFELMDIRSLFYVK